MTSKSKKNILIALFQLGILCPTESYAFRCKYYSSVKDKFSYLKKEGKDFVVLSVTITGHKKVSIPVSAKLKRMMRKWEHRRLFRFKVNEVLFTHGKNTTVNLYDPDLSIPPQEKVGENLILYGTIKKHKGQNYIAGGELCRKSILKYSDGVVRGYITDSWRAPEYKDNKIVQPYNKIEKQEMTLEAFKKFLSKLK